MAKHRSNNEILISYMGFIYALRRNFSSEKNARGRKDKPTHLRDLVNYYSISHTLTIADFSFVWADDFNDKTNSWLLAEVAYLIQIAYQRAKESRKSKNMTMTLNFTEDGLRIS